MQAATVSSAAPDERPQERRVGGQRDRADRDGEAGVPQDAVEVPDVRREHDGQREPRVEPQRPREPEQAERGDAGAGAGADRAAMRDRVVGDEQQELVDLRRQRAVGHAEVAVEAVRFEPAALVGVPRLGEQPGLVLQPGDVADPEDGRHDRRDEARRRRRRSRPLDRDGSSSSSASVAYSSRRAGGRKVNAWCRRPIARVSGGGKVESRPDHALTRTDDPPRPLFGTMLPPADSDTWL